LDYSTGIDRGGVDALRAVFERLDRNCDGKIDEYEVFTQLKDLGYTPAKETVYDMSEALDMIFEVDEDNDNAIDWEGFVLMYHRCRTDLTGNEPKRFFNLVDFMAADKDSGGSIDSDELMAMLYRRYGKDGMAARQESITAQIKQWEAEAEEEAKAEAERLGVVQQKSSRKDDNNEVEISYSQYMRIVDTAGAPIKVPPWDPYARMHRVTKTSKAKKLAGSPQPMLL
jgi:Ca2+-binding EF-hand superfamily protein